jgi:hypothetical protein
VLAIRTKINFQKLAERSVWLYINDEEFRNKLHNTTETEMLKSSLTSTNTGVAPQCTTTLAVAL